MWMYLLTGAVLAAVGTLVPLHLAEEGVQPETVGAIFVVASLVAALVARPVGVWTDRRGPLPLSVVGLLVAIPALAVSALASSAAGLAAAAVAGTVSGFFVAVTAGRLMAGAAAGVGISVGTTGPLMQFTSATGEILGAIGGAVCAVAIGDGAPFLLLSGLALATLTYILRRSVGGRAGLAGET